ncbi:MAG: bifunctional riboflavin kinase/FMN adenylyltransferase [Chloroflexi bacterium]|nr:bifunctional riboflavin kinase/FMN adenylyltransferase [Chloroflexota bacterium]
MTVPRLAREELARAAPGRDSAVTIGKFDGVHRGHQHLIARLIECAGREDLASVVVTLHPNPITVIRPGTVVTYLCSLEERLELLRSLGPDSVGILSFTSELGYRLEALPLLAESSEKVGSTAIRDGLARGEMERVAGLLARPYSLRGPVVTGEGRGKSLGFPTANVAVAPDIALPAYGVYVTRAFVGETAHPSCTNIGVRPTFDLEDARATVETYILDFEGELYGREVRIDLLHRLRDELRFESVEDLVGAIREDISDTEEYFRSAEAP